MKRLLLFLLLLPCAVFAQEITFTAEATTGVEQVTPVLSWTTTPAASSCTASGDWSGDKGPSGSESLAPISSGATYNLSCEWAGEASATLSWTPPTENTDGSPLTDLAGYKLYYGQSSGVPYDVMIEVDDESTTTYVVEDLAPGTWFFAGTAVNELGVESEFSNEATKILEGTTGLVRSVAITVNPRPKAMSGFGVD